MPDRISDFLQDYDDLVGVVATSTHTFYQASLTHWLALIDETPEFAREAARLEALNNFDAWYGDLESRQHSHGMGSTQLGLPSNREAALGMQLSLFRRMADGRIGAELFAHVYIAPSERNVDRGLNEFSRQIFIPAATALRRLLERNTRSAPDPDIAPLPVPASDRTVALDHNSPDYAEAVRALDEVEQALEQSNDYDDADDKEQRIAEVSAGRRLLQATRVRGEALIALIFRGLTYLAKKFADIAIGAAATAALAFLGRLTGLW
jgi:hypothetical protein